MTEHKLEKTSKYIETNPFKQPPREEIRTIHTKTLIKTNQTPKT